MTLWGNRGNGDDGASLVEFALLMPFLIILLLGIIEFGWLMAQNNDVRHGAREGARLAAVNAGTNVELHTSTCDSMDTTSATSVQFQDSAIGHIGDTGAVTVIATPDALSGLGLIEAFLPDSLTTTVEFRLEQPSGDWSTDATAFTCP